VISCSEPIRRRNSNRHIDIRQGQNTPESGLVGLDMELEPFSGEMELHTRVIGQRARLMDMGD